ncbi:hypothetical protein [Phocaeicola dorei]|uniref:hypothetical protein n=1 Tax=Phocaeicola dorei TaxID=357276 RepID=UPI00162AB179|nr:hypothetical protein [Phocaeicola dorei]
MENNIKAEKKAEKQDGHRTFFDKNSSYHTFFYHLLLSLSESVYNGLTGTQGLPSPCLLPEVANYQGMSRHMDMRTLRIQSQKHLPEAPYPLGFP